MHVQDAAVNLHRNSLVRDYCNMAESVGVDLHYGPNLHIGAWEQPRLNASDRQYFNSVGYGMLVRKLFSLSGRAFACLGARVLVFACADTL